MNGIEKITERIAADSGQEAKVLMDNAKAQAAEINAGYAAEAEKDYAEAIRQGEKDAAERIERMNGVAQLEAKKLHLSAKQEMLDKAFDLALKNMLELPEDRYAELLVKLALSASSTGTEALVFSETDRARYGKRVVVAANELLEQQGKTAALTLSEESRPFRGGLYVQSGKVETNCTFASLVRLQRQNMAKEVADILFA